MNEQPWWRNDAKPSSQVFSPFFLIHVWFFIQMMHRSYWTVWLLVLKCGVKLLIVSITITRLWPEEEHFQRFVFLTSGTMRRSSRCRQWSSTWFNIEEHWLKFLIHNGRFSSETNFRQCCQKTETALYFLTAISPDFPFVAPSSTATFSYLPWPVMTNLYFLPVAGP